MFCGLSLVGFKVHVVPRRKKRKRLLIILFVCYPYIAQVWWPLHVYRDRMIPRRAQDNYEIFSILGSACV